MTHAHFNQTRRHWLKRTGLCTGSALASGTLGNLLIPGNNAVAADYKALVCVFLYGGNDGINCIVPTDNARYASYSAVRKNLALPQPSLLPLTGSQYGLHPALSALQKVWNQKRLAPVFNVGPLQAPLTQAVYNSVASTSPLIPSNLFSHSDQQVLWETGTASSLTRTGWGGRASQAMGTTNPVISIGSTPRFGLAETNGPLVIPNPGGFFAVQELAQSAARLSSPPLIARASALRAMYARTQGDPLTEGYAGMQRQAFDTSARLAALVAVQPGSAAANAAIDAGFAPLISVGRVTTGIAQQLYQTAKFIAANGTVGGNRQIFFAQQGGFDTHAGQIGVSATVGAHANLLKLVGDALACFDAAMTNLGMGAAVTTFTQSDFGRTFKPNNSIGTDHAWGNTHLVMGGAVKGGVTYGQFPELALSGADDVSPTNGQGRWIPTTSVDQYASTLLSWFGAADGQLDAILPNLRNFGSARRLGFV